ncbi:MAG TPA: deoxyribonuclease IV [Mycobacteriales bacterium]|nr:deoxyribonuclease IV [Mycobacteriales bacterium]
MPPRKPSPIGCHVPSSGNPSGLSYAERAGAQAIQIFVSNPRGWAQPKPAPAADAAFAERSTRAKLPVFVHAPYLVNFASPTPATRDRSAEAVQHSILRGGRLGARGVVLHAGAAVDPAHRDAGLTAMRELLLPVLDQLADDDPDLLIEPTAGGGQPIAATVEDLEPLFAAFGSHPRLGVCLDTCHAFAAGHDLAKPGGVRTTLNALVRAVGRGRLKLLHANDSKDPLSSKRDRHATIGTGTIGTDPFTELFRHPATRGVPVIVETPGGVDGHARDIALLKTLRDS